MAGRIARLLGRQTPDRPDVAEAVAQLVRLAEEQPELREGAALQTALIRTLYGVPALVVAAAITAEDLATRLAGGVPLLRNTALPFEERHLRELFLRLCGVVRAKQGADSLAAALEAAVRQGQLDLWALSDGLVGGEARRLPMQLEGKGYPAELTLTLLRLALLPFLEQVAAQLTPLRSGIAWGRGYCPTCGAWPVLAEQRGLEQFRYLRCGLCASSWQVDRVLCPFCENRNYLELAYLQVEGEEAQRRAATCDVCRGYIKLRSTLTPLTTPQLLVEELALLHLDLVALDQGYRLPG